MNQVVVVPYPGRGHINPLLNLCHSLSSRFNHQNRTTTVFTVVVTEEWLGLLNPDPEQDINIRFLTIPNILPSELNCSSDMLTFLTAVHTQMERPFVEVLDRIEIELPVKLIIADVTMSWPFDVADRRNIPVAAYSPMSASTFSVMLHVDLLESHNQLFADVSERGKEIIDYIPGLSSLTIADIPKIFRSDGVGKMLKLKGILPYVHDIAMKANYVLLSTVYGLESEAIDALRARLQTPVYTSGPNIPYSRLKPDPSSDKPGYLSWLDSKQPQTVLYVSLGSFFSASRDEMVEIATGLAQSGLEFLWVARGETSHLKQICGEKGMVVEWCDQLRVLSHSSIGGFWTHCGWNSVKESVFSGVAMLTFSIGFDQPLNSKIIVKDWKMGWNMRERVGVFKSDEIARVVCEFMDSESVARAEMVKKANEFQRICQESVGEDGSVDEDLNAFVREIALNQNE